MLRDPVLPQRDQLFERSHLSRSLQALWPDVVAASVQRLEGAAESGLRLAYPLKTREL